MGVISFGIGSDYLPNWTVKEALREIFQNYIDYGHYEIEIVKSGKNSVVTITNNYTPTGLEFLRIGNSNKTSASIGKWGEGLKMAFLVMLREKLNISIITDKWLIKPVWINDRQIGKVLAIDYIPHKLKTQTKFITKFVVNTEIFTEYYDSIIKQEDIIYSHSYHGNIVNRPAGHIYCGGLFVCSVQNMTKAYDLKPEVLPLDRDRVLPRTWDVNYHCSKLNEAHDKWSTRDLSYTDTSYISFIPKRYDQSFRPHIVGDKIEVQVKHEDGEVDIVKNESIINAVKETSFFKKKVAQLTKYFNRHRTNREILLDYATTLQKYLPGEEYNQLIELIKNV